LIGRKENQLKQRLFAFIHAFALEACGDSAVEVAILPEPVKKRPGEEDHHPVAHNFKFMPYLIMVEVEAVLQLSEQAFNRPALQVS